VPELVVVIKAIGLASRSVLVFFLIWLVLIYFFAVIFRQITAGYSVGETWFPTVPDAMNTLLLNGILADYSGITREIGGAHPVFWVVMVIFVLLASITIMYMLVGVLVDVIGLIASTEKEGMTVSYLARNMRQKLELLGHNCETPFTKYELQKVLIEPDVCLMLKDINVDVEVLMDMLDISYETLDKSGESMTFEKLMNILLNGRGANTATVRDTTELLRILKAALKNSVFDLEQKIFEEFSLIHADLQQLREEALERDGIPHDDYDEEEENVDGVPITAVLSFTA
jgi:hypothetical protein